MGIVALCSLASAAVVEQSGNRLMRKEEREQARVAVSSDADIMRLDESAGDDVRDASVGSEASLIQDGPSEAHSVDHEASLDEVDSETDSVDHGADGDDLDDPQPPRALMSYRSDAKKNGKKKK